MLPTDELDPSLDLEPNEDIIERVGNGSEPLLLWTQTCPDEDCPCRLALVVAASSRAQLDAHVANVRKAWDEATDAASYHAAVPAGVVAFELDIDSGEVTMPLTDDPAVSPEVASIAAQIDGDLLDRLASQWYLGKEQDDASTIAVSPAAIRGFQPGQLLAWDEVYQGARMDVFSIESTAIEAIDTYCVRPKCECNDVHIQFYQVPTGDSDGEDWTGDDEGDEGDHEDEASDLEAHVFLGTVNVKVEDPVTVKLAPNEDHARLLGLAFERYQARYPHWVQRLADRADKMAAFGQLLHAHLEKQQPRKWVSSSRKRRDKK